MHVCQSPNLVGCPLGILQLLLYCKYRKKDETVAEEPPPPQKLWDLESCGGDDEDNNKVMKKQETVGAVKLQENKPSI